MTLHVVAIAPYLPYPPDHGGRIRTFQLLRDLARRGHRVDLVALTDRPDHDEDVAALRTHGITTHTTVHPRRFGQLTAGDRMRKLANLARGRSDVLQRFDSPRAAALARDVAGPTCDVVLAETLWVAPIALSTPARCHVLDTQNVEHRIAEQTARDTSGWTSRWLTGLEAAGLHRDERTLVGRFDAVIAVSDTDRDALAALAPGVSAAVVPNCIDTEARRPLPPTTATGPTCLFVGSANYPPNGRAVEWFVRDVFPHVRARHPDARFVAVGADPPGSIRAMHDPAAGIEIAGYVDDIDAAYASAHVVVAPITIGGGTRTKILEAFALARPVVATTRGASGLDVDDGEALLIADDATGFAEAVGRLLEDAPLTARLTTAARSWVEQHASARASGARLERVLVDACARETSR